MTNYLTKNISALKKTPSEIARKGAFSGAKINEAENIRDTVTNS